MELSLGFPISSRGIAKPLNTVHRLYRGGLNRFTLEGVWGPGREESRGPGGSGQGSEPISPRGDDTRK